MGAAMLALGRSLAVARGASIVLAAAAAALPYLALRDAGSTRSRAAVGVALGLAAPWSVWLGAATVPESFTASATTAAAIALSRPAPRRAHVFGAVALAACLSRYEAWPVAAVIAIAIAVRLARGHGDPAGRVGDERATSRRASVVALALVVIGPLAWIAWNAHAHDGPLHFFRRVSGFKRALGEETTPIAALLFFPRLLVESRPDVVTAAALALARLRAPEVRARWGVPLLAAAAQLAFLSYGNLHDGAPAHHAERALLGVVLLLATFAGDVLIAAPRPTGAVRRAVAGILALAWVVSFVMAARSVPGASPGEAREAQISAGARLRHEAPPHVTLTPCAYEHFALIAAFGAPELVESRPKSGDPLGTACPGISVP